MGHRLSKIYTRTGDAGTTGLADGSRVSKDSARIAALGDLDELNSVVGLLLTEVLPEDVRALLTGIQHDLFDLGARWRSPARRCSTKGASTSSRRRSIATTRTLGPLKEFILPGGTRAAALAHLARGVCRRAERQLVGLAATEAVSEAGRQVREPPLRPAFRARPDAEPPRRPQRRALAEGSEALGDSAKPRRCHRRGRAPACRWRCAAAARAAAPVP